MILESPLALLLLLVIPLLLYWRWRRRPAALRFSSIAAARTVRRSWRQRLLFLPLLLRIVVIILLALAIARPQEGREQIRDVSKGVAIYMVVDRSGSMQAEMSYDDQSLNRLDVVKNVFKEFVHGNDSGLNGRPNDLVGMISFARYADTICPLTLAHGALEQFLKSVQLVRRRSEDGTAIGDALALAAARLKMAEQQLDRQRQDKQRDYQIKSKVIILLTDGEYNCGQRTPEQAAQLAKKWGIKIYIIGIGGSESYTTISTPLGDYKMPLAAQVDTSAMRRIAETTGGAFWSADDADSLRQVYRQIDKLEKTEIESLRYLDYREIFSPFVVAALLLLIGEVVLNCTLLRRIP